MSEAGEEHMRPHPTDVREKQNTGIKFGFRKRTEAYHYPFAIRDYCDIEFHNVTGEATTAYIGLKAALEFVQKPSIFFICYDVGYNRILETFVRHVVCSLAVREGEGNGLTVYMFDMRNFRDISAHFQADMEKIFTEYAKVPVKIVNAACLYHEKCVYLQRFKGDHEMGWCIGWALLFLDYLTTNPEIAEKSPEGKKKAFAKLYAQLDKHLAGPRSNHFIEAYYTRLLDFAA
jgi:hypothetical protein